MDASRLPAVGSESWLMQSLVSPAPSVCASASACNFSPRTTASEGGLMSIRHAWTVAGTAVLSCAVAFAQSNGQATAQAIGQAGVADNTPITLVGCIQREVDYRRTHDL